jgi:hypothetical protein
MNCYRVTLRREVWTDVYVHANSSQEATSLAYDKARDIELEEEESELEPLVDILIENTCTEMHEHQYEDEADDIDEDNI